MDLEDRNIVVTGSGRGIGKAIAVALAREGANIVSASLHKENADEVTDEVRAQGRKALSLQIDVTSRSSVKEMMRRALRDFPTIHVFCNNAGVSSMNRVVDLGEEEWDFNMNVNAKGVFFCC